MLMKSCWFADATGSPNAFGEPDSVEITFQRDGTMLLPQLCKETKPKALAKVLTILFKSLGHHGNSTIELYLKICGIKYDPDIQEIYKRVEASWNGA